MEGGGRTWVVHMKHETLCLSQWKQRHFEPYCGMQSIPHHGNNKKGGSLQDVRATYKSNWSPWKLKNEGGPTWCATQRRKHYRLNGKMEWLGEQKAKYLPSNLCKTLNVHGANQKPCQRWLWRKNGCAICLKCFSKINLIPFQ